MAYTDHNHEQRDKTRAMGANVADKAMDLAEKASNQVDKMMTKAEAKMSDLAEQGGDARERVQEVAGNMKSAVDKSVKDQPMTTLLVAAAVGFALGALWKS
jgi:ElaB/YqjD/DUF883 family membrane-anchored ribosome-binding protein